MKDNGNNSTIPSTEPKWKQIFLPYLNSWGKEDVREGVRVLPSVLQFQREPSVPWALDPPLGCEVSRKSQTTVYQPVSAAQKSIIRLFSLLDITWKCKGSVQANREIVSTLYPNLFSLTSLAFCQRRCEVASSRRLCWPAEWGSCECSCMLCICHTTPRRQRTNRVSCCWNSCQKLMYFCYPSPIFDINKHTAFFNKPQLSPL